MKKILCLILLLSACSRTDISKLEDDFVKWQMTALHLDEETALIQTCQMRVWIKMTGLNWREFLNKKLGGYDISYYLVKMGELSWIQQSNIKELTKNCVNDKYFMYATRD